MVQLFHPDGPRFTPDSVEYILEQLSHGRKTKLSPEVGTIVLQRLVELRACELCDAGPGHMCHVFGGFSNLMRTHTVRLALTSQERSKVVTWGLREERRRRAGEATPKPVDQQ